MTIWSATCTETPHIDNGVTSNTFDATWNVYSKSTTKRMEKACPA
jgi:hypothetical protein